MSHHTAPVLTEAQKAIILGTAATVAGHIRPRIHPLNFGDPRTSGEAAINTALAHLHACTADFEFALKAVENLIGGLTPEHRSGLRQHLYNLQLTIHGVAARLQETAPCHED